MTVTTSRAAQFEGVLRRYGVDLSRLRGGRGVVRCVLPRHDDRIGSLSLDLNAAVFHCFGCARGGGLKTLLEVLGDAPAAAVHRTPPESDLQLARRAVMQRERVAETRRMEWAPLWQCSDRIRQCLRTAREARHRATLLGPDDSRVWPLLEGAATVEREGLALEAELDEILLGRVA